MPAEENRLVVGVDFGTTYSGVSWILSPGSDASKVHILSNWPGVGDHRQDKVPSRIAYKTDNAELDTDRAWGYEVSSRLNMLAWFKLLLDNNARQSIYDDPGLKAEMESIFQYLLKHHEPEKVAQDYLTELYSYIMSELTAHLGEVFLSTTPIEFWFTIPAIWSDAAKSATYRVATAAGFTSRDQDSLEMLPEPEAAAIAVLKTNSSLLGHILKNGDYLTVVDCGGGTVDMTTYRLKQISPSLKFEESCIGLGGKCGSTMIDRNFFQMMKTRFGAPFMTKGEKVIARVLQEFIAIKHSFVETGSTRNREIYCPMKDVPNGKHYDKANKYILLSTSDLKDLFDSVVDLVLGMIDQQISDLSKSRIIPLRCIILVGGFGGSRYLMDKTKAHMAGRGITVICPADAWSAIARGAALRGLEGSMVQRRKARRHYGTDERRPFKRGRDDEEDLEIDPWTKRQMCDGWMNWCVPKGRNITPSTKFKTEYLVNFTDGDDKRISWNLYASSCDVAPKKRKDDDVEWVGSVWFELTDEVINHFPSEDRGEGIKMYRLHLIFDMMPADDAGRLEFRVRSNRKVLGTAQLDFTK